MKRKNYIAPCITVYRCEPVVPLAASQTEEHDWRPDPTSPIIHVKEEGDDDLEEEITG